MSELGFILLMFALFLALMSILCNNIIFIKRYKINTGRELSAMKIVFLADLFSNTHTLRINSIIEKVRKSAPDIIIVYDKSKQAMGEREEKIISKLTEIAPVHLAFVNEGIRNGAEYVSDKASIYKNYSIITLKNDKENYDELIPFSGLDNLKILVCDNPSLFDSRVYNKEIDVAFSYTGGKTVVRIPFYGVIYSTTEGFLPTRPARFYKKNNSALVITTGVGKTFLPIRINLFREIPCVEIE